MLDRSNSGAYKSVALVQAAVLAATSAGTTGVDVKTARSGLLLISLTVGSDVATAFNLEQSEDNSTWEDNAVAVSNTELSATGLIVKWVTNIKRYLRVSWTRAASAGDSYWAIGFVGMDLTRAPAV